MSTAELAPAQMFRPTLDNVVVKRHEAEAVTPGGIHLPDTAQTKANLWEIQCFGPKFDGEIVIGPSHQDTWVCQAGDLVVLREQDREIVRLNDVWIVPSRAIVARVDALP
jgi:co-chaperonin GroES (HSP10)